MDFIRDPLWQFIGALLAVLAIIISIILFLIQRRKKILAYEIISRTPVLSAFEEISGKLQILFEGESVRKVHLLVIKLSNIGNVPVTSADYEREIEFRFTDCDKILSAEISKTNPPNLTVEIQTNEKEIILQPLLLNPGDSLTIKTLISNFNHIAVQGRVTGVKSISEKQESNSLSIILTILGLISIMISIILISTNQTYQNATGDTLFLSDNPLTAILFFGGYLIFFIGSIGTVRKNSSRLIRILRKIISKSIK